MLTRADPLHSHDTCIEKVLLFFYFTGKENEAWSLASVSEGQASSLEPLPCSGGRLLSPTAGRRSEALGHPLDTALRGPALTSISLFLCLKSGIHRQASCPQVQGSVLLPGGGQASGDFLSGDMATAGMLVLVN